MREQFNNDYNPDITSLIKLLLEQQRGIRELVEDVTKDIEHLKIKIDDIGIIRTKLDSLEKSLNSCQSTKGDCQARIERTFKEIVDKREGLNSRISALEVELTKRINDQSRDCSSGLEKVRTELEGKLESRIKSIGDSIKDIQVDIKKLTGEASKYGGVIALIVSIVMFMLKALWDHTFKR